MVKWIASIDGQTRSGIQTEAFNQSIIIVWECNISKSNNNINYCTAVRVINHNILIIIHYYIIIARQLTNHSKAFSASMPHQDGWELYLHRYHQLVIDRWLSCADVLIQGGRTCTLIWSVQILRLEFWITAFAFEFPALCHYQAFSASMLHQDGWELYLHRYHQLVIDRWLSSTDVLLQQLHITEGGHVHMIWTVQTLHWIQLEWMEN